MDQTAEIEGEISIGYHFKWLRERLILRLIPYLCHMDPSRAQLKSPVVPGVWGSGFAVWHGHTGATFCWAAPRAAGRGRSCGSATPWRVAPNTSAVYLALTLKLQPRHTWSVSERKQPRAAPSGVHGWIPEAEEAITPGGPCRAETWPGAGLLWLLTASPHRVLRGQSSKCCRER